MTPEEYRQYKRDAEAYHHPERTAQREQDIARLDRELRDAISLRTGEGLSNPRVAREAQEKIDKTIERLQQYKDLAQYIADADAKIEAIEAHYRNSNPLVHYDQDNAGNMQMTEDISNAIKEHSTSTTTRKERLKTAEDQLKLDVANVTTQQQILQYQREINSKEATIAAAKADQASAVAADERRQKDLADLASQRKGVQDRWRKHYDQLTAGQDYKDRETPKLKRLLTQGQHMADAGYMSEQDAVRLGQMRDEALKGLPRELVNHSFLLMALQNGLDLPIMNPNVASMMDAVRSYCLLANIDKNAVDFIAAYGSAEPKAKPAAAPADMTLSFAIENGLKQEGARITRQLLEPLPLVQPLQLALPS